MWAFKTPCGQIEILVTVDGWLNREIMKKQKRSLNIIDVDVVIGVVSNALKMVVNGCHVCVCKSLQVIKHISTGFLG